MSEKIYTIEEIKKILEELLRDKPVYQVILFGSYAKHEATKESDIDLIINTNSELKGFALLKSICQIEELLQKNVDGFEKYEIVEDSLIHKEIKQGQAILLAPGKEQYNLTLKHQMGTTRTSETRFRWPHYKFLHVSNFDAS